MNTRVSSLSFNKIALKFKSLPLNLQLNLVIGSIILIVMAILTTTIYMNSFNYIKKNYEETGRLILQETVEKIDSRLKLAENTAFMISSDSRIQNFNSRSTSISEVNSYLNDCIDFNRYETFENGTTNRMQNIIDDIIFINDDSTIIARKINFTSYNIKNQLSEEWLKKAYAEKGKLVWTNILYNKTAELKNADNSNVYKSQLSHFMLIRYIFNEKSLYDIGYIAISINLEKFSNLIENISLGKSGKIFVIDESGKIIASKEKDRLLENVDMNSDAMKNIFSTKNNSGFFEGSIDKKQFVVFHAPLSINNWRLVIAMPLSELKASVSKTLLSTVLIGLLSFVIITSIISLILNNLSKPLKKMLSAINKIKKGDLNQRVNIQGCFEVNQLCVEFNFMLEKINSLLHRIVEEERALRKSELKNLRAQINPHFLYNTLDSIRWLVKSGNSQKSTTLLVSLSSFFRIGLSGGNDEILIGEEVEHVRQYLIIQKIRCDEKFDYLIYVDPDLAEVKTLKLILQPIVENAILHGLTPLVNSGSIKIVISKKDSYTVNFEISDNGIGITPEELENLNSKINSPMLQNTAGSHGYAMRNINQRIKLNYGDEYGIKIQSSYGKGVMVTISIPITL